jgi:hypothetical protein
VKDIKSYVGAVIAVPATEFHPKAKSGELLTLSIVCEAILPGSKKLAEPLIKNGNITCGEGTKSL